MTMYNKKNISFTTANDLCTGCGICIGVCPVSCISMMPTDGNFRPKIDENKCINCKRCLTVCPGIGININKLSLQLYPTAANTDKMCGRWEKCFTGYSNDFDIRYHSASGGTLSQFIIWLLENNKIDGAVVTKFDARKPFLVKSFLASSKEDIISARSSKYSPVTLDDAIEEIATSSKTRFVLVGLPCHIHGIRKRMLIDKKLQNKEIGLFAIYCSCGRSFYMTDYIFKERGIPLNDIEYFQYRDEGCLGKMVVKVSEPKGHTIRVINNNSESALCDKTIVYKEHYQSYYHPLRSFFVPKRCLLCIDHYGELADVCFGDIHIKPYSEDKIGINSIIVRNKKWLDLLLECQSQNNITLNEIPFDVISSSQRMSLIKKGRNGAFVKLLNFLGRPAPKYDVNYLRRPTAKDCADYIQTRIQQFIGKHKKLWPLISVLKAKVNIN